MKTKILLEEINSMKYLLGYKRGVVMSEQQVPQLGSIQPSNQSAANMFKDSLAAVNQLVTNNPFAPKTQSSAPATPASAPAPATPATATPATPATPATATPATPATPAPATPAPATPATPATATNVSMPDLIGQIQTILNTKFGGQLNVDRKWGPKTQAAFENALKTIGSQAAPATPAPATPAPATPAPATSSAPATPAPARSFNIDPNIGKDGINFTQMTPEQLAQGVQSATPPKQPTRDELIAKAKADLKSARQMR